MGNEAVLSPAAMAERGSPGPMDALSSGFRILAFGAGILSRLADPGRLPLPSVTRPYRKGGRMHGAALRPLPCIRRSATWPAAIKLRGT